MRTTEATCPSDGWGNNPPICKLPLELILHIIALSLPDTYPGDTYVKALYSNRMVSRMWRDAVDSTPSLWNVISDWVPSHINSTSIQRSGSCPLDVYVTNDDSRPRLVNKQTPIKLIELAAQEIRRWSTVWLWLPSSDVCTRYLTSPAPLLRELYVIWGNRSDYTTPVALFGGITPRLEALEVDRVPMDWNSPVIHGLRRLDLSSMIDDQISTQQVLDILTSAPLLEGLIIRMSFLDPHLQPFWPGPAIIQLPNLSTIHLESTNRDAVEIILSSIRTPNCRSLTIIEDEDDLAPPSFLERALGHFSDFLRRTLSTNKQSTIKCWDERMQWESHPWPKGPNSLEFLLYVICRAPATGVRWVTGIIGLGAQEVEHDLEVSLAHERFDKGNLVAYHSFGRCQSVTRLVLYDDHAFSKPILELLGSWQESSDSIDSLPTFPKLRDLRLAGSEEDWTLDDLEVSVNRRFGEPGNATTVKIPNLSIDVRFGWYYEYCQMSKPSMGQLQRLRSAKGVETLTRNIPKRLEGMVAIVYEDDTRL